MKVLTSTRPRTNSSTSLHAHFCFDSDASRYSFEYTFPNNWENVLSLRWECHRYRVKSLTEGKIQERAIISPWPKAWYPVIDGNWVAWHDLFLINPGCLLSPRKWLQIDYLLICSSLSGNWNYSDWSAIPWISLGPVDLNISNLSKKSHFCSCSFLILACVLIPSCSC